MKKYIFLILLIIAILGCKSKVVNTDSNCDKNCFANENGFTKLNFYNNKDYDIEIFRISSIISKDFQLIDEYYDIRNDTLFIRKPNEGDVSVSHIGAGTEIKVNNPKIKIRPNNCTEEIFKISRDFNVIVFDSQLVLTKCSNGW